jgi:hypothetical protein
MFKVYACLAGSWICTSDDPQCRYGLELLTLDEWWLSGCPLSSPGSITQKSLVDLPFVDILFEGTRYRVHPSLIQFVEKP